MRQNVAPANEQVLFRQAYRTAFASTPVKKIALDIALEGWMAAPALMKKQQRRRWLYKKDSRKPWFGPIGRNIKKDRKGTRRSEPVLPFPYALLKSVCDVAEKRERDQESGKCEEAKAFAPGRRELLVRYVKTLFHKTMDTMIEERIAAFGCVLLGYSQSELASIMPVLLKRFPDAVASVRDALKERFPHIRFDKRKPTQQLFVHAARTANDREIEIVQKMLRLLAEWKQFVEPPNCYSPHVKLFESLLHGEAGAHAIEELRHVISCPKCGGIHRLEEEELMHDGDSCPKCVGKTNWRRLEEERSPDDAPKFSAREANDSKATHNSRLHRDSRRTAGGGSYRPGSERRGTGTSDGRDSGK